MRSERNMVNINIILLFQVVKIGRIHTRLETDYPSEMSFPLDNLRQTDKPSYVENGTVLIFDGQSA